MDELKAWLGDVFYKDVTISEAHEGYVTEYYRNSYSDRYETIQLPFSENITIQKQVLDMQAVGAFVLIVMTFLTVVTWLRSAFK